MNSKSLIEQEEEYQSSNEEADFWREFLEWWESKYHQPAAPRLIEAMNIAEARGLRFLADEVDKNKVS